MPEQVTLDPGEYETLIHQVETLSDQLHEATLDANRLLAAEDSGWASIFGDEAVIDREAIAQVAAVARVMVVADPLIKRGVNLRIAYLGVPAIAADSGVDEGQDVNAVVQQFLDDPGNRDVFSSAQAVEERERGRATDGNNLHALVTNPRTGRVQVRHVPFHEVREIVTDPEDNALPWLYLREYSTKVVEQGYSGLTRTRAVRRRVYYPDVNFRPNTRPRSIDGIPVEWDKPIVHTVVNRPEGSRWGVPDTLAALPWARGYKTALEDWAKHHKALASIAFRASVQGRRGAAAVRAKLPVGDEAGRTIIQGEGQTFETVKTAGAALPATAAEPLAGMVAAALDVPKTMLLSDPGTTGARAVAETLDRPMKLDREARRELDTDLILTVLNHVIRESVRAPLGLLKGRVYRDEYTGREVVELANNQETGLTVDWPSLEDMNLKEFVEALSAADAMDKLPPLEVARMLLVALEVENVDELLKEMTDKDGNFVPPSAATAERLGQRVGYDDASGNEDLE